ncbi:MAG: hypothetical protein K2M07_08045 [Muribaculaceae bacterium]|nr:hypothetical protein [Muribaculaceae bacterium]
MKLLTLLCLSAASTVVAGNIYENSVYRWSNDSIIQGPYKAYAESPTHIVSDYAAQPHYFMPIEKEWMLKNDISAYPRLTTDNKLHTALYNMALDEMVNAVEPDTTLRTGKEWAGVWTRDVSYSIIGSMAYMQPLASKVSLMKKVNPNGRIIQDTGSGGAWPVSSDRMIWAVAAYELYKVTGDRQWLEYIYPVIRDSFEDDFATVYDRESGLVKGETSFIDWREQSYPKWMQTADIYNSEAMNTAMVHAVALDMLAEMAGELGDNAASKKYSAKADDLKHAINEKFWMDDKGYYGMYLYGRDFPILNPRAETLGESLAVIYGIADDQKARRITESNPVTPFGSAIFYPQISDMPSYHNNGLWPWVAAYWAIANKKAGNEQGVLDAIGSVFRPAALFCTNKENLNLDNGDIATELNSSNMLWCLAGNIAITTRILFGIEFEADGLRFEPFVPRALAGSRTLENFPYRDAILNITVNGYGDKVAACEINGKKSEPFINASGLKKGETYNVTITLNDSFQHDLTVNRQPNKKAPLTPITWVEDGFLRWNPIEYIGHYIVLNNGKPVAETRQTRYPVTSGEYQVIGVSADGIQSFASEPRNVSPKVTVQMPDEKTVMTSSEVAYAPESPVEGFSGGFLELDHSTSPVVIPFSVDKTGEYAVNFTYANGNGPVNTENKCAIRSVLVDGKRIGSIVMPQRGVGNWNDWGQTNSLHMKLTEGDHLVTIEFLHSDENMNLGTNHAIIDCMNVLPL